MKNHKQCNENKTLKNSKDVDIIIQCIQYLSWLILIAQSQYKINTAHLHYINKTWIIHKCRKRREEEEEK